MHFEFKNGRFDLSSKRCFIFGILNVTPDSFSDGGSFFSPQKAVAHAVELEKQGADAIDVGGESTRPGSPSVSENEELRRVIPVIQELKQKLKIPISIDTNKTSVAEMALREGASIVNDVSGLRADPRIANVVAAGQAGLILMHSRGTPETMQTLCQYSDILKELRAELQQQTSIALSAGIKSEQLVWDPGIGFAKTKEQNWFILENIQNFIHASLYPVLVGLSRKSFLGGDVSTRGHATLEAETSIYHKGVRLIRTHDVGALRKAIEGPQRHG
jgi:dihydropteroate synthase